MYVVDGKESVNIENLDPDDIESVTVLNDDSSTALYGERAKNGVIIIVTKASKKINNH